MALAIIADLELPALRIKAFDGEEEAIACMLALKELKEWIVKELSGWIMQPKSKASRKKLSVRGTS